MAATSTTPSRDIGMKIRKLAFLMDRIAERTLRERADLTFSQFRLLRMLMHAGALSQQAIASFHGLTNAAVSRQVDHLVKQKLVTRTVNTSNRRQHVLMLTSSGTKQAERAKGVLDATFTKFFKVLSERSKNELRRNLDRLLESIWEEHGKVMCGPHQRKNQHHG